MSLLCRLKNLVHKGLLKKEDLDRIVIIPKEQENKVIKTRYATPEERESIAKYINDISKQTVVNFWDLEQEPCKNCSGREYFISDTQPKIGHCKDCKYFEYNRVAKIGGISLIVAHKICKKWGDGCMTSEDGYCYMFESNKSEE